MVLAACLLFAWGDAGPAFTEEKAKNFRCMISRAPLLMTVVYKQQSRAIVPVFCSGTIKHLLPDVFKLHTNGLQRRSEGEI